MGPPYDFVLFLRDRFNVNAFVEGGTFLGNTAAWAGAHFETVYTIERAEAYFEAARSSHKNLPNVRFILGDTRHVIPDVLTKLARPAMIWLDSHWCGAESYGVADECPLLDEIEAVNRAEFDHFVLIDDARLFLAPPPRPHVIEQWPTIDQVVDVLQRKDSGRYIVIIDDVIIAVPSSAKDMVARWCQNAVSEDNSSRDSQDSADRKNPVMQTANPSVMSAVKRIGRNVPGVPELWNRYCEWRNRRRVK